MVTEGLGGGTGSEVPEGFGGGAVMPSGTYPDDIPIADPAGTTHDGTYSATLLGDRSMQAEGSGHDGTYPADLPTATVGGTDDGTYRTDLLDVGSSELDVPLSTPPPATQ